MARVSVTESELGAALRSALAVHANTNDAFSAQEIANALACGIVKARGVIAQIGRAHV